MIRPGSPARGDGPGDAMIGTTRRRWAAAALSVLLVGCGGEAPGTAAPASGATAFLVETPEFSVGLPQEPVVQTQAIAALPGVTATSYTVERDAYAVSVGVVDYPPELPLADPTTVLVGARDGALARVPGGTLTGSTPATVDGRPALDIVATATGGGYRSRIILDGRRLYQLITGGTDDRTASHDEFVASLHLRS